MPDSSNGCRLCGRLLKKAGCGERDQAEADGDRHHEQVEAVVLEIDRGQDARAGRGDHAEHHKPGAAEYDQRNRFDQRGHFWQQPKQQHDASPPVTVTQRERTPVTLTRPTFCENDV